MTEEAQPATWKDRLFKQSAGIRQAERLLQASGLERRGRLVERLVRKTQDGTLGTATPDAPGADDVIQVGDNHYTVTPAETPAAAASTLGKTLATAAAALLAGGGGVGAAMWALSGSDVSTAPPAAVALETPGSGERAGVSPPAIDTDTKYRLRLVD